MVDTIYANVNVQGELEQALPPRLQPLAGPAAGALRTLLDRLANEALQRPRVQEAWESINRAMHERLIVVVEEDVDEPVTLDLGDIVEGVGAQAVLNIADRLPPDAGQIEVIPARPSTCWRSWLSGLRCWHWSCSAWRSTWPAAGAARRCARSASPSSPSGSWSRRPAASPGIPS